MYIFQITIGLLSTADTSVPVSSGGGDDTKVDSNGRRTGRPPRFFWNEATALKRIMKGIDSLIAT